MHGLAVRNVRNWKVLVPAAKEVLAYLQRTHWHAAGDAVRDACFESYPFTRMPRFLHHASSSPLVSVFVLGLSPPTRHASGVEHVLGMCWARVLGVCWVHVGHTLGVCLLCLGKAYRQFDSRFPGTKTPG